MSTPFSTFAAWISMLSLSLGACGRINIQPRRASDASVDVVTSSEATVAEAAVPDLDAGHPDGAPDARSGLDAVLLDAASESARPLDAAIDSPTSDARLDAISDSNADATPDMSTEDAPPPLILIATPGEDSVVATGREVTLTGTLPADTLNLATESRTSSSGTFGTRTTDRDFTDGTFALTFSLNPVDFEQRVNLRLSAAGPFGSIESRWIELIFRTPVLITSPSATGIRTRNGTVSVRGTCQTSATQITALGGAALADSDCSDLRWNGFVSTSEAEFAVRGVDPDTMIAGEDFLGIALDSTAPTITTASLVASSGSRNFAGVDVTSSESGLCAVYLDAACEDIGATQPCQPSIRASVWVPENAATTLYARSYDNAMNESACQLVGTYTHAAAATPPPCDVMFGSGGAETGASFRAALVAANTSRAAYLADGFVTVCIAQGTVITVADADAPVALDVDDLYLTTAGPTKARFMTTSTGALLVASGQNVTLDNLAVDCRGTALSVSAAATIRAMRNMNFTSAGGVATSHFQVSGMIGTVDSVTSVDAANVFHVLPYGFIGSISNVTATRSIRALHLGGIVRSITSSRFQVSAAMNGDVIALYGPGVLGEMNGTTWDLTGPGFGATFLSAPSTLEMQGYGIGIYYVGPATLRTARITNNIVCGVPPGSYFTQTSPEEPRESVPDGTPTIPSRGTYSDAQALRAFPWGDSSDVANAPWNLQTQWGGPCP